MSCPADGACALSLPVLYQVATDAHTAALLPAELAGRVAVQLPPGPPEPGTPLRRGANVAAMAASLSSGGGAPPQLSRRQYGTATVTWRPV